MKFISLSFIATSVLPEVNVTISLQFNDSNKIKYSVENPLSLNDDSTHLEIKRSGMLFLILLFHQRAQCFERL